MNIKLYKDFIFKVFFIFDKPKRYVFLLLIAFLFLGALDLLGISLIGPFVLIFFDFDRLQTEWGLFVGYDQEKLALYASLAIISIFLIRSIFIWLVNAFILNVSFNRQVEVRSQLLEHILEQEYSRRLTKNTAHYTTAIFAWCQQFVQSILNIFRVCAEGITIIFIVGLLIATDIRLFLTALTFALTTIFFMIFFFSRRFVSYGENKNKGLKKFSQAVHESIFGIKEIKILGLKNFFSNKVKDGASIVASAEKRLYLFSIVPRYLVETLLVTIICMIMLISTYGEENIISTISTLSIFMVAAIRLLPSISLIVSAFNSINLDIDAVNKLYEELTEVNLSRNNVDNTERYSKEDFRTFNTISFDKIKFGYEDNSILFENISLDINKGDFIGLVGESGEGKTSMIDLLLGINKPLSGDILVDGKSIYQSLDAWRSNIAYLPQETFLISGTLAENIALGQEAEEIDVNKVTNAINKAGLGELLGSLPEGLNTEIGERGLKFSGGQRQRVALARAFFSERDIFLLDESTSALDKGAASRILTQVHQLAQQGSTVILISHNEEMLKLCSRKLRISQGAIKDITTSE